MSDAAGGASGQTLTKRFALRDTRHQPAERPRATTRGTRVTLEAVKREPQATGRVDRDCHAEDGLTRRFSVLEPALESAESTRALSGPPEAAFFHASSSRRRTRSLGRLAQLSDRRTIFAPRDFGRRLDAQLRRSQDDPRGLTGRLRPSRTGVRLMAAAPVDGLPLRGGRCRRRTCQLLQALPPTSCRSDPRDRESDSP